MTVVLEVQSFLEKVKVGTVPSALAVGYVGWKLVRVVLHSFHFVIAHTTPGKNLSSSYGLIVSNNKSNNTNSNTNTNTNTNTNINANTNTNTKEQSYIVVSGTTNRGIGYAFAQEFAAAGFSLLLIGRGQQKLETIAIELKKDCHQDIDVKCVEILDMGDIGGHESTAVQQLTMAVQNLDVAGVVHAAGMETMSWKFSDLSLHTNRMAINLNAASPVF